MEKEFNFTSRTINTCISQEGTNNCCCCYCCYCGCCYCCCCYYSSKDYTSNFGSSNKEGSFTPNIHHTFNKLVCYYYTHVHYIVRDVMIGNNWQLHLVPYKHMNSL